MNQESPSAWDMFASMSKPKKALVKDRDLGNRELPKFGAGV